MQKMTCNNPKLDLAKMNAYKLYQLVLKIMSGNEILAQVKDHNSGTNVQKITCDNPKLDLVNMNAYIKFGKKCQFSRN